MNIKGIPKEKLDALIREGFSEEYLRGIMETLPDENNPNVDLNEIARSTLGLSQYYKSNTVRMTAGFNPIPNSGFNRGKVKLQSLD